MSRKIEKRLAENPAVEHVRSTNRQGLSIVFVDLYDTTRNAEAIWQDLDNKLAAMTDLPTVAGAMLRPRLDKDFGDTVAVMLTISSPPVADFEVDRRAAAISRADPHGRSPGPPDRRSRRPAVQRRPGPPLDGRPGPGRVGWRGRASTTSARAGSPRTA